MKINIIVVDDDRAITENLKQIIAEWPEYYQHTVSIKTENSLSNISAATVTPYDLVILDVLIQQFNPVFVVVQYNYEYYDFPIRHNE